MALLKSLEIIGIRNFSPNQQNVVHFSTPVVLFQGQNGSGKTTILECIRYGLTGELPSGTGTGAGFLNDPKMSKKDITKASVKVKFLDAHGNSVTVCRVLQVKMKRDGELTFKRLNFSIHKQDKDTKEVQDFSGRCIDIDTFCCSELRVSKSIFNNVLFCHQENSLWPLDEPKKLKEKFDEIFEAIRYKKCIESMIKIVRFQETQIKVLKATLEGKNQTRQQVEKMRAKCEDRKQKLLEIKASINEKSEEMEPLQKRMKEILELEETLGALQRSLSAKEEEKKGFINQQKTLESSMTYIFEGSDEELEEKISVFKKDQSGEESLIRELEKNINVVSKQIETINVNVQSKQVEIGQMKQEQKQYRLQEEESKKLINKLRLELDIEDLNDKETLLEELTVALNSQQKKFGDLKLKFQGDEKKLQESIDKMREENAGIKQSISSKSAAISDYNKKLKDIRCKLEDLDTSDSQLNVVNDKIKNYQQTLMKIKNAFNENEKLQEIEQLKELIDNKEQYLEKLDREYRVLQRNFATEQKLESERSSVIEKQGLINKMKSRHSENLKILFKEDVPERNLRKAVLNIQNQQEVDFKKRTQHVNDLEKQITTLDTTLNHQKSKLKADLQELSVNKRKVGEVCKKKDFATLLKETYEKKERYQKKKGHMNAAILVYGQFAKNIGDSKCCPVCQTNFEKNTVALPGIIRELKNKVVSLPTELANIEIELRKEEALYNELQQLKTVNDLIEAMEETKIPKLEKEINNFTEKLEEKMFELAAEKENITTPQKLIEACKNLITDATLFDQYQSDIMKSNSIIEDLEQNIEKVPSNRTREETEMEIDSVKGELSNTKNRYDTTKNKLDQHRDRCQELNKQIQTETQKQIDIQKLVQEKPLLEKENEEYKRQISELEVEIEDLNMNLGEKQYELQQAEENRNQVVAANRESQEEAQNKIIYIQSSLSEIHKLERSLKEYENKGRGGKLDKAVEELAELKVKLQNFEKERNETSTSISEKKEAIAKKESHYRALRDNVVLRETRKKETIVDSAIKEMKQKIGGYNYRQVFEEKGKKNADIDRKQRQISNLKGQLEEVQEQYEEIREDLEKPENRNAYNNYKKHYYEVAVEQIIVDDLNKYLKALERSVLRFHEERMAMINESIQALWRSIYRGNDIDYIQIRTDENTGTTARRRTYTYKVVQIKNTVELDMRGRCSAGQKVLACVVIRLALAETFSVHCGIFALDEPTTNLDHANIKSLSDALSNLIDKRENLKNFQLLIITHDEEFMKRLMINCGQKCGHYWHVRRLKNSYSVVSKETL